MWTVLIIMGAGFLVGYFLRNQTKVIKINDRLVMIAVFALLFLMGVAIGGSPQMISQLHYLGVKALAIAIAGIIFSVAIAVLVYHYFFKNKT
ncbi:MAG: hypothetical protein C0599_06400 [Salinivirgaceae bacterium]|nr:MAG: hypothetical protein C0599_06400 [Salinivirgaceae bacterium]